MEELLQADLYNLDNTHEHRELLKEIELLVSLEAAKNLRLDFLARQ